MRQWARLLLPRQAGELGSLPGAVSEACVPSVRHVLLLTGALWCAQILRELKMQKAQMLIELQRAENRHLAAKREQARPAVGTLEAPVQPGSPC